ncbi:MAG: hypothetical protein ACRDHP_20905, partial [Ktedonobacterales bacterium]
MNPNEPPQEPTSETAAHDDPSCAASEGRQRRVDILGELARQSTQSASVETASRPSQSRQRDALLGAPTRGRRRRLFLTIGLILIVVVGGLGAYFSLARPGLLTSILHPVPAQLTLDLSTAHFSCPSAVAWSPDGSEIAVLAQRGSCGNGGRFPSDGAVVLIYDASSGKLATTLDPTSVLQAASASLSVPDLTGMSWSPDGTMLALPAVAFVSSPSSTAPVGEPAAVLLTVKSDQIRLLRAAASLASPTAFIWDVHSGTLASQIPYPLPLALQYRWTSDGHIVADQALPTGANSAKLTGSPVTTPGSATFSVWQPGAIHAIPVDSTGHPLLVDVYAAPFSAWSPDGRYVVPILTVGAAPMVDAPYTALSKFTPAACAPKGLPSCVVGGTLPNPDSAFAQVAVRFAKSDRSNDAFAPVAWSLDGKRLATMLPGDNFSLAGNPLRISVLDTSSGAVLHSFQVISNSQSG